MAERKATDEQLLEALTTTRSPVKLARMFDMSERAVIGRIRKLGIPPLSYAERGDAPKTPLRIAHGRIDMKVSDGVVVVFSDAHYFPGVISTAHRALLKLIEQLKPVAVCANGDVFDGAGISRHPRIGWDSKPGVMDELKAVKARMDEIEAVSKGAQLIWQLGNHCARFETYLAANAPQFEGVKGFTLKDHFPFWRPCWGLWVNDDVVIKHRMRGGIHATHNNTVNAGVTMVTGHLHSLKVTPFSDYRGTRFGVDTGTLADPYGPQFSDYTELGPTNWRSGFAVLTFRDGKLMWPELVHVLEEGVAEFRGEFLHV
jgi:hypothetical protein